MAAVHIKVFDFQIVEYGWQTMKSKRQTLRNVSNGCYHANTSMAGLLFGRENVDGKFFITYASVIRRNKTLSVPGKHQRHTRVEL